MLQKYVLARQLRHAIDYWSMPHFLLGTLIALIGLVFGLPAGLFFFVTLVVAVLWEIVEMRLRIREAKVNVASDIIMPLFAYVLTLWLTASQAMQQEQLVALLSVTIITYVLFNYAAWRARFNRDPDFLG
jgi:hypothetical protein